MPNDGFTIRRDERGRALELNPAMRAKVWQKGYAPNPGGISGDYQKCRKFCRDKSLDSAVAIYELGKSSEDERVRYMANTWIYEQAWGKAKEYDPREEQTGGTAIDPAQFTPEVRALIMQALRVLVEAQPMAEVIEPARDGLGTDAASDSYDGS